MRRDRGSLEGIQPEIQPTYSRLCQDKRGPHGRNKWTCRDGQGDLYAGEFTDPSKSLA